MRYSTVRQKSEEGNSVSCPGLPGCWLQNATEAEALENIREVFESIATQSKIYSVRHRRLRCGKGMSGCNHTTIAWHES